MQQQFKASINGNYLTVSDRPAAINLMEVVSIEKCSFCDGYGPIMHTNEATLEFDGNQLLVLSMDKNAQKYDGTEAVQGIRYCPMCGRRLGD